MQVFYAPDIQSDFYTLDNRESRHLIRVLRVKKGSDVRLIDGKGNLYEGVIEDPDPVKCSINIISVINNFESRDYTLHLAISPLKNPERFEWFVEKSVEIGVDEITPVICRNTEKPGIKSGRINNVIISAMKQSLKAKITLLNEPVAFTGFMEHPFSGIKMIASCSNEYNRRRIADVCPPHRDALIMIGPEGDFSPEETGLAVKKGFIPVHLGTSRLRSETAGVAACHSIYFINQ